MTRDRIPVPLQGVGGQLLGEVLEWKDLDTIYCLQDRSTGVDDDPAPQPGKLRYSA